jgi:Hypothetical protein FLILHELTA
MSYRQLLRKLTPQSPLYPSRLQTQALKRSSSNSTSKTRARVSKILDRVPRPLRKYTNGLRTAPITHIISFLVLHEITAVVPLVGLSYYFHASNWLPVVRTTLLDLRVAPHFPKHLLTFNPPRASPKRRSLLTPRNSGLISGAKDGLGSRTRTPTRRLLPTLREVTLGLRMRARDCCWR